MTSSSRRNLISLEVISAVLNQNLNRFHWTHLAEHRPRGPLQRDLVERLISYGWRRRRASCYESYLVQAAMAEREESRTKYGGYYADLPPLDVSRATALLLTEGNGFDKIARYEAALERGYFRCLERLEKEEQGQEDGEAEAGAGVASDRELPQGGLPQGSEGGPAGSEAAAGALVPLATEA